MMKKHRDELMKLKEEDPEFYNELEKEGKEMLEFDEDEDMDNEEDADDMGDNMDDVNEDADEDADDAGFDYEDMEDMELDENDESGGENEKSRGNEKDISKKAHKAVILTPQLLKEILDNAEKGTSKKDFVNFVALFTSACISTNLEQEKEQKQFYKINSSDLYQEVMTGCISLFNIAVEKRLWQDKSSKKNSEPTKSSNWKALISPIKKFLVSFSNTLEAATEPTMIKYMLDQSKNFMKYYIAASPVYSKLMLKILIDVWSGIRSDSETSSKKNKKSKSDNTEAKDTDIQIGLSAYLRIKQLSNLSSSLLEKAIRDCYIKFVRGSKFANEYTVTRLAMQARCFVDLLSIDASISYELTFVFVRKMALMLHEAISAKSVESLKMICSWQFVHSLRIWTSVLCTYSNGANTAYIASNNATTLDPLVYPLIQVILGTMNLLPSEKSSPFRLHLCSLLIKLEQHTNAYVPVSHYVGTILQSQLLFGERPLGSTKKPLDIEFVLRLKKDEIRLIQTEEAIVIKSLSLLREHLLHFRTHVSYPEIAVSASTSLREFVHKVKVSKWRQWAKALLKEVEDWYITSLKHRSKAKISPSNFAEVEDFKKTMAAVFEKDSQNQNKQDFIVDMFAKASKIVENQTNEGKEDDSAAFLSKKERKKLKRKQARELKRQEEENGIQPQQKKKKTGKEGKSSDENGDIENQKKQQKANVETESLEGSEDEVEDLDWSKF